MVSLVTDELLGELIHFLAIVGFPVVLLLGPGEGLGRCHPPQGLTAFEGGSRPESPFSGELGRMDPCLRLSSPP